MLSLHLAYIDQISDLPTSPIDVQDLVNSIGGTLEGDAGNDGYSSEIHGVISFAGGINDLNWIDANDEPLVCIQGDNDGTVSYNCAPGLGLSSVLTLCGTGEMQPQADLVGITNDALTYFGEDHNWAASGSGNALFDTAVQFAVDFLYPLLPCNNITSNNELNQKELNIYPNPASDQLFFEVEQSPGNLEIRTIQGQLIRSQWIRPGEGSIDCSSMERGLYILQFKSNGHTITERLILR